jgi:TP901-1 family phage major tail protein
MATTGIVNASLLKLYLGTTLVAHGTSAQLSMSVEMMGATTKDSAGWEESLPGRKSWTISGDFLFTNTSSSNKVFVDFFDAITAKTKLTVYFSTMVTGDTQYYGSCYVESAELSAGTEENATYSVTLRGTGAISKGTYTPG